MKTQPNRFVDELKEYFNKTSKEQILKDWIEVAEYDSSKVTADMFIEFLKLRESMLEQSSENIKESTKSDRGEFERA